MNTTKIIEKIAKKQFKLLVSSNENNIRVSPHAFDHLSDNQKLSFTEDHLKKILLKDDPQFIALQRNGRYSAFYKRKEIYLNLIIEIKSTSMEIVNFMNKDSLPVLKK